jgi:hypothetical protein
MAERLRTLGIAGPLASNDWWDGLHTAYYLDAQYAGTPAARDPKGIVAEMRREGAKALIIWRDLRLAFALRLEPALEFMPEATPRSPDVGAWAFRLR